ncbi:MAG: hypothetical protein ACRDP6_47325 [Actinoallomurus sp.]
MSSDQDRQQAREAVADRLHDAECDCGDRKDHEQETGADYGRFVDAAIPHLETVVKAAGGEVRTEQRVAGMRSRVPDDEDGSLAEIIWEMHTVYVMPWRKVEREYPDVSGGGVPYPPREVDGQ